MTIAPVLAGAVAGVLLAVAEGIWLAVAVPSAVAPVGGPVATFVALVPRGFVVGAGLGLGGTFGLAAIQWLARLAGRRGGDEERCFAAMAGALLMVAITALAQPLWDGRGRRFVTDHPIVLTLVGAAVAWCSYEVVLVLRLIAAWIHRRAPERRTAALRISIPAGLFVVGAAAYVADHVAWVELYEPFHIALRLCAFVALQLSILAACLGWRTASPRTTPRWLGPSLAILAIGLALVRALGPRAPSAAAVTLVRIQGGVGGSLVGLTGSLIRTTLFSDGS
jgi:hypothetical protein